MIEEDIEEALQVFASHGYCESPTAESVFKQCDPNAFYVAVRDSDQKIIGVCAAPTTSHSTGFFGTYCVLKEYQSRQIGRKLFDKCLNYVGDRNCGLIGVSKMSLKYQRNGFNIKGSDVGIYTGVPKIIDSFENAVTAETFEIKQYDQNDKQLLDKIIKYDTRIQNWNREKLITLTLLNDWFYTLIALNEQNDILGFGCIKSDIIGEKLIGPVYADNDSIAEALIHRLVKQYECDSVNVSMSVLISSNGGTTIANKMKLRNIETCNELYSKFLTPINRQFVYCMHSLDFAI